MDHNALVENANPVLPVFSRMVPPRSLHVRLFPREGDAVLGRKWRGMESACEHAYFTGWEWISSWLGTLSAPVLQCEAHADGELVGLGLFVELRERRLGFIPFKRLFLHRTGDHSLDRMCIQWNDLLIKPGLEECVRRGVIAELTRSSRGADEVVFGYTQEGHDASLADPGFVSYIGYSQPSPWVDLERVRVAGGFEHTLSHKTRANVRKSLRMVEALGPIELRSAATAAEALGFFRAAGPLHIERFKDGKPGRQSGYLIPSFVAFHERLIPAAFANGNLDFLKITAGGVLLAYMYFLIHRGTAFFYLSSINYASLEKGQPGLVANYLCIRRFAEQGLGKYDFLAGDALYKRVLATDIATQNFFRYRKRSLKMGAVEKYLAWKRKSRAQAE